MVKQIVSGGRLITILPKPKRQGLFYEVMKPWHAYGGKPSLLDRLTGVIQENHLVQYTGGSLEGVTATRNSRTGYPLIYDGDYHYVGQLIGEDLVEGVR